eukprot:TRINITY_DN6656_c0_g1_i1.p1 TRINITY_DN6656_c0_g1~~TRINITY_DN6656_c0_g1_i1.p1  ORF type:complete len:218 (-),score=57.49 TRINITY_DN6656_c0_g1_i1:24-635(-)
MQYFDSLPYVDVVDPNDLKIAENLVNEEMKRFRPSKDYLSEYPNINLNFENTVFLSNEFERLKSGKVNDNSYDFQRLLKEPNERAKDEEWENSIKNAKANYEHQQLRIINLELLNSYGKNSWLHYLQYLQNYKKTLALQLEEFNQEITIVNRKRKIEQDKFSDNYKIQQQRLNEVNTNNIIVKEACEKLENSIKEMEEYLKKN